ncbi:MAG: DMT family transporter [Chloroflexi bacterium]|nr:DMT family transporter [Chloroflexota bacterium]
MPSKGAEEQRGKGEELRRNNAPLRPRTLAPLLPYLALVLGVTAMGMSGIFVRWANAPGAVTGFYRMLIAIAVFALPVGLRWKRESPLSARHLWFAVLGGIFFAFDLAIWNTSVMMTSAANATLFGNTSVIWVALGALILFKEKLRPIFWGGLILACIGILVVLGQDFLTHPTLGWGDTLAMVAGVWYGFFFLVAERARDKLSSLVAWWVSSAASTVGLFAICLALGYPLLGYPPETYWSILGLAIVVQVISLLSVNYALGHLPASIVAPTSLGQPVVTAILAIPLLGQSLDGLQIVGGLLVMAGIIIVHRSKAR